MVDVTVNNTTYDATLCDTTWKRSTGLMFQPPQPLLFVYDEPTTITLHSVFVFHTFTAIFLDDEANVVDVVHATPFLTYATRTCTYVVEVPGHVSADSATLPTEHLNKR